MTVRSPLLEKSALELAALIRNREISSLEAVEAHIAHASEVNPGLNAIVRTRYDLAREEATRADETLAKATRSTKLPLLHGVPCTIKECFAFTGMPNSSGLVARRDLIADYDATAVGRIRAAGAIPLGVTNISELCMWMESNNCVYGRTNNPYDARRTVGGSSGGEGAIVGSGASPFGLGSDVGGSIRMPAFFNGVFGHKPTGGAVPGSGQHPYATGAALRYVTTGPIARRASDLMPLMRILAGPDGLDEGCIDPQLGDPDQVDLRGMNVVSVETNGIRRVSDDLITAQRHAADALRARGANVRSINLPALSKSLQVWSQALGTAGGPSFHEFLGDGEMHPLLPELLKWPFGKSKHTLPAIVLALIEKFPMISDVPRETIEAAVLSLRREVEDTLGPGGVMLYPSYTRPAPIHTRALLTPLDWLYTAVWNVLELPVTQVPLGLNAQGIPLGVQVVGHHRADHVTIAVAQALEADLGGWVPPWKSGRP
jgi:fatty acid amide hydrolase 2